MIFYSSVNTQFRLLTSRLSLIMKLAVFFTAVSAYEVTATRKAQNITQNVTNRPLTEVMEEIKKQSGYHFFLKGDELAHVTINTSIRRAALPEAMNALTRHRGIEWIIKDNVIILRASSLTPANK